MAQRLRWARRMLPLAANTVAHAAVQQHPAPDQPNHPSLATAMHNLASVHRARARLEEAEAGYRRALAMKEAAYADQPNHPSLATAVKMSTMGHFDDVRPG